MGWKVAMQEERAALDAVVSLLCALAGLAELAAGRSALVRCLVLALLRRADAAAREFVLGPASPSMRPVRAGSAPADAMRLAAGLRALACLLGRQTRLGLAERRGGAAFGRMPALRDILDGLSAAAAAVPAAWRPARRPDTS